MKLINIGLLMLIFVSLISVAALATAHPAGDPEAAIENMRQIPQWHCKRYRKFDLVRRCRNYRNGRKH
ncbi:uncharacterized protein LOC106656435 [Trichogramma pretiosum]|uniref:uncharacterized protein LOC106656435 n=1 Tax=Trichogramma pretiosum TaxID=7493 RepID=UPI0006C95912|nr:uncharacterized protein LOC106656435 [Trichogramma pretiosum]